MSFNPISKNYVNIFFIEHAEAEPINTSNVKGEKVLLGDIDAPLNEEGRFQAETLAYQLMRLGIVFERILSSDLLRAAQTAAPVAEQMNIPVTKHPELRETSKGELQGKTQEQYTQLQSYKDYKALENDTRKQFFSPMGENGESKADAARKMIPLLNSIRSQVSLKGKCVAIFTHGNPLKVVYTLSLNPGSMDISKDFEKTVTDFPKLEDPKPCQVVLYHADDTEFYCMGELNEDADKIQLRSYPRLKS